ncbi:NADH dehydrogenase [Aeromicrobium sp. Root344]|uniref:NAD(P)/FAD-dependent oxidoreductase n=1 Tax=Aeromicrobium sp. Root344 TaxID=1736521 RepID=UPI0006F1D300|nr:NAD(P)/FAD-dependent oxidoreductase [Aeromicrobium sp. Root344]KQV74810.1 NADH dehydrogenase [Aeromicrobium sp. Root344]
MITADRSATGRRPRVVIVGGGFGGLQVAKGLRDVDAEVVVIDRVNHHLFQPLLYQVSTALLAAGDIAPALRTVLARQDNARVVLGDVTDIDPHSSSVTLTGPDDVDRTIEYDRLVLAAGAESSFFGHDDWAEAAVPMKTLVDAITLRERLLGAFELAAQSEDLTTRGECLTFVVVGAGPTGVEFAGQLSALARRTLRREFHELDTADLRIVLVDAGDSVLSSFAPSLQRHGEAALEKLGVERILGHSAETIDAAGITVRPTNGAGSESRISARTVVWAAGVATNPLARRLAETTGAPVDGRGRIKVDPRCRVPGYPDLFAIGDAANVHDLPGLAEPAMQEGRYVASVLASDLAGASPPAPFRYRDLGTMATISPTDAVAQRGRVRMSGLPAKLAWAGVHVAFLVGWGNRFAVLMQWLQVALFGSRRRQLIIGSRRSVH